MDPLIALYADIAPTVPTHPLRAEDAKRWSNLLHTRSEILERVFQIAEFKGLYEVHQADVDECEERLVQEDGLTDVQRRKLKGRQLVSRAKAVYALEKIKQSELEMQLFRSTLTEE